MEESEALKMIKQAVNPKDYSNCKFYDAMGEDDGDCALRIIVSRLQER